MRKTALRSWCRSSDAPVHLRVCATSCEPAVEPLAVEGASARNCRLGQLKSQGAELMARFNRLPRSLRFAIWLVIGIALPFASSRFRGIRNPQDALIHDEMTYLVQADTFSRGRLTNPAPRHPEFFEAPYLLMEPTYQAKYPPAQALFLAIGQRFAGPPIWGVWLTCGLFAAALDWMLCGWVNGRWAMIGTAYAVGVLGITHSWATTYWGGMVAATGGALLLGGTRWTLRRWTSGRAVLTALGVVIVLNSRPYEGAVVCLACGTVLAWWLVRASTEAHLKKAIAWCGPFLLVAALGGVAMGVYNKAVTGSWITPPYVLQPQQYFTCGMFRWQPINQVPKRRLTSRVGQFYEQDSLLNPGKPGGPATRGVRRRRRNPPRLSRPVSELRVSHEPGADGHAVAESDGSIRAACRLAGDDPLVRLHEQALGHALGRLERRDSRSAGGGSGLVESASLSRADRLSLLFPGRRQPASRHRPFPTDVDPARPFTSATWLCSSSS